MLTYLQWLAVLYDVYGEHQFRRLWRFSFVNRDMAFLKRASTVHLLGNNKNFNPEATARHKLFNVLSTASQEDEANGRRP